MEISTQQELNGLCRPRCGAVRGAAVLPAPAVDLSDLEALHPVQHTHVCNAVNLAASKVC